VDVDATGVGRYPGALPGDYEVSVLARGYAQQTERVAIGAGETRLTMRLEPVAQEGRLSLQGTILDSASGRPIAGVRLRLQDPFVEAYTDSEGVYRLYGIPPGARHLSLSRDGYGARFVRDVPVGNEPGTVDFRLDPAATLHLHVTDKLGRAVVGNVSLGINGLGEKATKFGTSVEADAQGHAVYRQIVPGRYQLLVSQGGVGEAKLEAEITDGENVLRVRLE
jgi:protocatechuate 3,4-dioxygenase beta subunit